jgi:hypothetical protein
MSARFLLISLIAGLVAAFAGPLRADELHLRSGKVLEGKVVRRDSGGVRFRLVTGEAWFPRHRILRVVEGPAPWETYAERAEELDPEDVEGHLELAAWCRSKGLRKEMKAEALVVVKCEPDHAAAREMLGQLKVGEDWLPRKVAMQVQGYVWNQGQWRLRTEVEAEEAARAERRRVLRLQREVNGLFQRIASESKGVRKRAHTKLVALADQEKLPQLRAAADAFLARADAWWAAEQSGGTAIVEVRATEAKLQGIRNFSTSLGTGSPVTIELPRLRKTSVSTTVGVPLGGGR